MTGRQTDRRTDGRPGKNNMSPDPEGGDIISNRISHVNVLLESGTINV